MAKQPRPAVYHPPALGAALEPPAIEADTVDADRLSLGEVDPRIPRRRSAIAAGLKRPRPHSVRPWIDRVLR